MSSPAPPLTERALQSGGISNASIYGMVMRALERRRIRGSVFVDVGCGAGNLWKCVHQDFDHYVGLDAVRYPDFPEAAEFVQCDLDSGRIPLPEGMADVVVAVEIIEHLENPRAFVRSLVRLVKSGGILIVTTPNQLSLLSLLTLLVRSRFTMFQDCNYPAHLTALLEIDLLRIGNECGLLNLEIEYSRHGRVFFSSNHYPGFLSNAFPRRLSDNILLIGRKPSF
jgi:2-polyprenyl-3-methyl-5-hydroxy-6-metoxy-1,4-benzoquinol methylase